MNKNSNDATKIIVGVMGNPNSGKTTIFNNLTKQKQKVANYPGVTVERKEGSLTYGQYDISLVDLPGTYSLTAFSGEESVPRSFIFNEKIDLIIDIIDSSNIERNLYLAVQLLEMNLPTVLVLNMIDLANKSGISYKKEALADTLNICVVETVGHKNKGMDDLIKAIIKTFENKINAELNLDYGAEIEKTITDIDLILPPNERKRWKSIKILENDEELITKLNNYASISKIKEIKSNLNNSIDGGTVTKIITTRYEFIHDLCQKYVVNNSTETTSFTDKVDSILTNKFLGIPIFLLMMYLVFQLVFKLGEAPMEWIDSLFTWLKDLVSSSWPALLGPDLKSLVSDGIIGGVGGVLVFLPNIILLFLAIAILEDSGYMARAVFLIDRIMNKLGLQGKSFIPMLVGLGCSVPAIMATRTLDNRRDRLVTMLVIPLMSCGARFPIYALIIPAFFAPKFQGIILWSIYVIGILLAIIVSKLLKMTILKGNAAPFIMEMPNYHIPTLRNILTQMWQRSAIYLKKAGTVILGISIILWAISSYPKKTNFTKNYDELIAGANEETAKFLKEERSSEELAYSISGRIGKALEPIIAPLGFDWKIGTALVGSFAAKEVFVAQMGIVYSLGEVDEESDSLRQTLAKSYSPLVGFCIMLFALISAPCMATIAVTKRESNSWNWAMFQLVGLTLLAYLVTLIVYQVGRLIA